jgi:predicted transposase YbfD/YdcC
MGGEGVVFTVDALHCQKTFEAAKRSGNALLVQVKGNQPNLLEALRGVTAS